MTVYKKVITPLQRLHKESLDPVVFALSLGTHKFWLLLPKCAPQHTANEIIPMTTTITNDVYYVNSTASHVFYVKVLTRLSSREEHITKSVGYFPHDVQIDFTFVFFIHENVVKTPFVLVDEVFVFTVVGRVEKTVEQR